MLFDGIIEKTELLHNSMIHCESFSIFNAIPEEGIPKMNSFTVPEIDILQIFSRVLMKRRIFVNVKNVAN